MNALDQTSKSALVNCTPWTPRTQAKRRGSRDSGSKSSGEDSDLRQKKRPKPIDLEEKFNKLDPSDPEQSKRIQQRSKDIGKGKNTSGYHAYIQQVPKEKRRIRSMDTPSTPNPSLDMSKKRWQGLVRAWRIALHKYDPADVMTSFHDSNKSDTDTDPIGSTDMSTEIIPLVSPSLSRVPSTPISQKSYQRSESNKDGIHDVVSPQTSDQQSPVSMLAESPIENQSFHPFDDDESDDDLL